MRFSTTSDVKQHLRLLSKTHGAPGQTMMFCSRKSATSDASILEKDQEGTLQLDEMVGVEEEVDAASQQVTEVCLCC